MVAANEGLIALHNVTKIFHTDEIETHALSEITLEIKRGDYLAIAGPSGCGKSTLLSLIGLIDSPTEGEHWMNGSLVTKLSVSDRCRIRNQDIGFIFQSFNLIGDLTVYENVELPLIFRGMTATKRKERVVNALERVGMTHRAKHYPAQLSGGQQQRAAVARSFVGNPTILLADEPTGNLDSKNSEAIMELLKNLHSSGATICLVTHDQRYIEYATRVVFLVDGRIVDEKSVGQIELNAG